MEYSASARWGFEYGLPDDQSEMLAMYL